jgi:hypothetical protein
MLYNYYVHYKNSGTEGTSGPGISFSELQKEIKKILNNLNQQKTIEGIEINITKESKIEE